MEPSSVPKTPKEKADAGMFLSLRELAEVLGFSHPRMCQIAKRPGFPLFEGRVRHPEFLEWYRSTLPSLSQAQPLPAAQPQPGDADYLPLRSDGCRPIPRRPRVRRNAPPR